MRTKISEFSATPGDNTDIDGIDIAEGCAPSGINNAIRELMAQLKDMQTGASGDTFTLTTVNSTTVDTTNLEATNLKAKDGTAAGSIANSTGVVTLASSVLTTTDINGGTIDGTVIGGASAAAATVTSLTDSGNLTFTGTGNRITGDFSNATVANRVAFQSSTTNGQTIPVAFPNGGSAIAGFAAGSSSSDPSNASEMIAAVVGGSDVRFSSAIRGTGTYLPMTFYTGGSEAMRITTSRNVGIGGSGNATVRLDVSAATNNYAAAFYANTGSGVTAGLNSYGLAIGGNVSGGSAEVNLIYGSSGGGLAFNRFNGTTITESMRLDSSGNLGIGTSSPTTRLSVVSSTNAGISVNDGTVNTIIYNSTGGVASIGTTTNHPVDFYSNNAARMRIDSSGNLLVGTTAQLGAVVARAVFVSAGNVLALQAGNGSVGAYMTNASSTGNWQPFSFNNNGTSFSQIGSITCTASATAYNTSSDYRLKENVQPMQGALATVAALKPVTYKWKSDGSAGQGFIAHELQAVVPDCVTGTKDAIDAEGKPQYQGVDTSFLVATLTAAIQEQQALITNLTTRLTALEGN